MREDEWMKNISSDTVCKFFYIFYVLYAILAVLGIVGLIVGLATASGKNFFMIFAGMLPGLIATLVAVVSALFTYLICDRALLAKSEGFKSGKQGFADAAAAPAAGSAMGFKTY